MKIALYSITAYLDTTIPLVNELCQHHNIILIIEDFHSVKTSIWETGNCTSSQLLTSDRNNVNEFLGSGLLSAIDRKVEISILRYLSIKFVNPLRHVSTWLLVNYLRKIRPDVIDIHGLHSLPVMPFLSKIAKVVTLHDPFEHQGARGGRSAELVKRMAFRYADEVIIHEKRSRERLARKFGISVNRINTVYLGALDIYKHWIKRTLPEEPDTVLFFGRISPYKGIEYLIESAEMVYQVHPGVKVIIAGSGDFGKYGKMIRTSKIFEIHNRYIGNEEAADFFQRAACVVLPYTDASQSGVLMVALAFNKPAIVTDVGGLPEMIENGTTGFTVPVKDANALAGVITRLLKSRDLREKMKINIMRKLNDEFSWKRIAREVLEVYESALFKT